MAMTYDYEYFKKAIYDLTKIDLNAYKEKQMKRRIDTLIAKNKIVGYDKYVAALKSDKNMFEEFVNYLTINVSEFYRNVDQWRLLDQEIIPDLIKRYGNRLKIWSILPLGSPRLSPSPPAKSLIPKWSFQDRRKWAR